MKLKSFAVIFSQKPRQIDSHSQYFLHFQIFITEIWSKVNEQIAKNTYGRLFAIVAFDKHQHKVTEGDLLMVLYNIGAKNGQRIRLDKIPLIGSKDFTLIGRPLLPRDLVNVEATVVEKSLSHKKIIQTVYYRRTHRKPHRSHICKYSHSVGI